MFVAKSNLALLDVALVTGKQKLAGVRIYKLMNVHSKVQSRNIR